MFEERAGNAYKTSQSERLKQGNTYRYMLSPGIQLEYGWKVSEYSVKIMSENSNEFKVDFFDKKSNSWTQVFNGVINDYQVLTPEKNPQNFINPADGTLWMRVSTKPENNSSVTLNKHYWEVNEKINFGFPRLTVKLKYCD